VGACCSWQPAGHDPHPAETLRAFHCIQLCNSGGRGAVCWQAAWHTHTDGVHAYLPLQAAAEEAVGRLYGDKATYDTLLPEHGFWARTLQLWYTPDDDSCESWRLVQEFPLGGEPAQ
jgi:hypothetical protein